MEDICWQKPKHHAQLATMTAASERNGDGVRQERSAARGSAKGGAPQLTHELAYLESAASW